MAATGPGCELDKLGKKQTEMDGPALSHDVLPHLSLLGRCHPGKEDFMSKPSIRTPNYKVGEHHTDTSLTSSLFFCGGQESQE